MRGFSSRSGRSLSERSWKTLLAAFLILTTVASSGCQTLLKAKVWIKDRLETNTDPRPTVLAPGDTLAVFQDGTELPEAEDEHLNFRGDVKKVQTTSSGKRLTDYPHGYEITVPVDMEFDFLYSPDFARVYGSDLEIRIARDTSPYVDVKGWLDSLPNEFITDSAYREANDITLHEDAWKTIGGHEVRFFSATRIPAEGSDWTQNSYTYAYIQTGIIAYHSIHFRSTSYEQYKDTIETIVASFESFGPKGNPVYGLDLSPVLPEWSLETRALYEEIRGSDGIRWGLFTPNPFTPEGKQKIAEVESQLNFTFPVIMWYRYVGHEFPIEGMMDAYESGKLVEMTYQIGGDFYERNPNFTVLDGDEQMLSDIRKFARGAKEFGHPFLMRLNNEMNSTWVSYSGHLAMLDPDIFKQNWVTVYRIFEEEGVDNAIWIFNPNDISYPPQKWNTHLAYYPGNEFVHMIGLTGYNTGDYFRDLTGEHWRSFTQIYDRLWNMYKDVYADFPWIITEFACSSVGGDKGQWIKEMFANLPRYKNIKIAVWWSYFDPDPREATYGTPARRYWLDEKPEYLEAFKRGLEKSKAY